MREALREAILDGELSSGTRLREEELAQEFGVSRTPIREALKQLGSEGLLELSPHQGAIVTRLTVEDILAIYVVREVLEGLSARLAARRATPAQGQALLAVVDRMEVEAENPAQTAKLNLQFHADMRHIANNHILDSFLSNIETSVRRFGRTTFTYPGRTSKAIDEHRAIVEAIIAGDPEQAEALAIRHMREARQIRIAMLVEDY